DPVHRVDDVAIEAREEAEAVLSGQVLPSFRAGPVDGDAAGLAAGQVLALEDPDRVTALDELVRRAHSRDPPTDDDDGCHPAPSMAGLHIASPPHPARRPGPRVGHGAIAGERVLRAARAGQCLRRTHMPTAAGAHVVPRVATRLSLIVGRSV